MLLDIYPLQNSNGRELQALVHENGLLKPNIRITDEFESCELPQLSKINCEEEISRRNLFHQNRKYRQFETLSS